MSDDIPSMNSLGRELRRVAPAAADRAQRRDQLKLAVVAVIFAGLVAGSFSPPGRAVAEAVGSLIGVGDAPTTEGKRQAVVIGASGEGLTRFEVVATSAEGNQAPDAQPVCMTVEFPAISGSVGGTCLTEEMDRQLNSAGISPPLVVGLPGELYPEAEVMVQGLARSDVSAVDVEYTDATGVRRQVPASLSALDESLSRQIGAEENARSYVAFLPSDLLAAPAGEEPAVLTVRAAQEALNRLEVVARMTDAPHRAQRSGLASGRGAALALALSAPEQRFATQDELRARCREQLAGQQGAMPDDSHVQACVANLIG